MGIGADDLVQLVLFGDAEAKNLLERVFTHHPTTGKHSARVMEYCAKCAVQGFDGGNTMFGTYRFPMTPLEGLTLTYAGMLHDSGKMSIPVDVLDKSGRLDINERDLIEKHVRSSVRYLREANMPESVVAIVAAHHDTEGYPRSGNERRARLGEQGVHRLEERRTDARSQELGTVLAICDSYDALTDPERTYRTPLHPLDALGALRVKFKDHAAIAYLAAHVEGSERIYTRKK